MIERKTVFIVGAGASAQLGFPLGRDLHKRILDALGTNIQKQKGDHLRILVELGFKEGQIAAFREALQKHGSYSVDECLADHNEHMDIGKAAIALQLIPFEIWEHLHDHDHDFWAKRILEEMIHHDRSFRYDTVRFVTFNYDRSLEMFFYEVFRSRFKMSVPDAAKKVSLLDIIHMHGQLGRFNPANTNAQRAYDPNPTRDAVMECIHEMRLIHEDPNVGGRWQKAQRAVAEADAIYFFGFSFHPSNMWKVGNPDLFNGKKVFGTCKGMSRSAIGNIKARYGFDLTNCDVGTFLHDCATLI
jgi:hypothetical protein